MASSDGQSFLPELSAFLRSRLDDPPAGSYSHRLLTDRVLTQRKIMEEAFEVCLELGGSDAGSEPGTERLAEEAADLVFHLLCGLVGAGLSWSDVEDVLLARHRVDR